MLSIVSVFNDHATLQRRLLSSLARQTVPCEVIIVDNRESQFANAAAALNHGAAGATGEWIVFVHQDVELLANDWLERAETHLVALQRVGWCGIAGRSTSGRWQGILRDRAGVFGEAFDAPVAVQTLDEVLLIHRNERGRRPYFDRQVPGWHAYGVEACCSAMRRGLVNYVLPLPIWHDSQSTNLAGLKLSHGYVWKKHRDAFSWIYTTCGVLPHSYGWSGSYRASTFLKRLKDSQYVDWIRTAGESAAVFAESPWQALERLTVDENVVECFHRRAWFPKLEAISFMDRPSRPRRIVHHYIGPQLGTVTADCLVVAPDLSPAVVETNWSPPPMTRTFVCVYLDSPVGKFGKWRQRLGPPSACALAIDMDGTRWGILEFARQCETARLYA